jgi:hypothetical protein
MVLVMGYEALLFSVPSLSLDSDHFWLKLVAIWDYLGALAKQVGHLIPLTGRADLTQEKTSKKLKIPVNAYGHAAGFLLQQQYESY